MASDSLVPAAIAAYGCYACNETGLLTLLWISKGWQPQLVAVGHLHDPSGTSIGGASLQGATRLGQSIVGADLDGDGVRDLVASTAEGRLLAVLMAAGRHEASAGSPSQAGLFVREAIWIEGVSTPPTGCSIGTSMQLLPPLHLFPASTRLAVSRPCDDTSDSNGAIEVAVIDVGVDARGPKQRWSQAHRVVGRSPAVLHDLLRTNNGNLSDFGTHRAVYIRS